MKFILFLMFFTAPPVSGQSDQLWALQNTSSMEFESDRACNDAANKLITAVKLTETVKMFGWCFPVNIAVGETSPVKHHPPPMPEFYSEDPAPIKDKKK
ncbi:MAG: hypothetical protein JSS22_08695 [Proteobacteria bacterium]|nr:hypothetical protein [Pseudomonadota bacterium]